MFVFPPISRGHTDSLDDSHVLTWHISLRFVKLFVTDPGSRPVVELISLKLFADDGGLLFT